MSDFAPFAKAVHQQFTAMSKGELFVVDISGDDLFAAYLAAFPEGTNPIYKERSEHDCSCCKNFIRNIGNVVAVVDGKVHTVWDGVQLNANATHKTVARALMELVRNAPIKSLFRSSERQYGAEQTVQLLADSTTKRWNHFHGQVANKHFTKNVGQVVGDYNTTVSVFKRGLEELTPEAFNTVADLIQSNALYRGDEFKRSVAEFQKAQKEYLKLDAVGRNLYLWANASTPVARFRNTAIGTLLVDLSAGDDLEGAVKSFEQKVAPTNYKRPVALITQKMVDDAMKTINQLGLEPALERRFARIEDVSVNDILFVDNAVRNKMKGGLSNLLADAVRVPAPDNKTKAIPDIAVDEFLSTVVPKATSMEVFIKNTHMHNFVCLTAPVHADVEHLFKWDNNFAWSYDGNVTDSIKERVKTAGGKVDAPLRVSLAWFNHDDLDLHVFEPSGDRLYFGNRTRNSRNGGRLDVDMNAGLGSTREPVENIVWDRIHDGNYRVIVNNYNKRETNDSGFTLELECNGDVHNYSAKSSPSSGKDNNALTFSVKGGKIVEITTGAGITGGSFSQEKWGVKTEQFTRVDTLMLSPNYWNSDERGAIGIGSMHVFFILEGCKNDLPTRGIYNEFLKSDLEKHRKVFELVGQKTMCEPTDNQLAGLGFTAARNDAVLVKVNGNKLYNVKF